MSLKSKFSLIAFCMMASGVANAASVGNGTLAVNGVIGTSTCTVSPSQTSISFPAQNPSDIQAAAANSMLSSQAFTFDFVDCSAVGNSMTIKMTRDSEAPAATGSGSYRGGFNYAATGVDNTKGPLAYGVKRADSKYLPLDTAINDGHTNNDFDLTGITDKSAFSIPLTLELIKAPHNGELPAVYTGNYSASVSWAIEYP